MIRTTKDPNTFRALEINDPHWSNTPHSPSIVTDQLALLENNLEKLITHGKKVGIDAILWGGDLFHKKDPRANPLGLIVRVIKFLKRMEKELDAPNLGIGGNHDFRYGSLEEGLPGSPLEVVINSGCYHLLDHGSVDFCSYQRDLMSDLTIKVAGCSYHHGQANSVKGLKRYGRDYMIVLGHFWLGTQTGEFFGEPLYGHEYFKDCEADVICVGHHHADHGVHSAYRKLFVAQGSITLTGAHAHDLTRRPAAALIEISKQSTKVELLRPTMPPIDEIIDRTKHEELKQEKEETDKFIAELSAAELTSLQPEEILDELNPVAEVKKRVLHYLELAEK